MASKEEWARWLEKDGEHKVFAIDEIATAKSDGWKEPETVRGNGQPWNEQANPGEGIPQAESVAKVQEGTEAVEEKRKAREAKEAASAVEASDPKSQAKRTTRN